MSGISRKEMGMVLNLLIYFTMLALVLKRKKKFMKTILKFIANCYNNLLSANGSYEDDSAILHTPK